jgi:hypothetical protein
MKYQDYIDLDFKRIDLSDSVEFRETGYYGFCLTKKVNKKMTIEVSSGELDKPKLYIKKRNYDTSHIIVLTIDMVKDIFNKESHDIYKAC